MRGREPIISGICGTTAGPPPHAGTRRRRVQQAGVLDRITPHAGTRRCWLPALERQVRITPARGDETNQLRANGPHSADHPRTRGRDVPDNVGVASVPGSPPHAGTRQRHHIRRRRLRRITPARGDETRHLDALAFSAADHPRTRGRDLREYRMTIELYGITPARGDET